ncbi:hypothetical protein NP493_1049g00032 [Ridgeia piscesae]|uniref:Uncharacterized protein n=1 Tax=Ridgeia piscesae TaxID=27915 RepID=A0AAD9NKG7_RIDPI|nr:hypothetical protein NP493_1049g00032 [Ridgeia piscesae]
MAPNHGRDSTDGYLKRRRSGQNRHTSDASASRPESCPLIKSRRLRRCRSRSHSGARLSGAKHVRFSLPCNGAAGKMAGSSRRSIRQQRSASLPPVCTSLTAHRHGSR